VHLGGMSKIKGKKHNFAMGEMRTTKKTSKHPMAGNGWKGAGSQEVHLRGARGEKGRRGGGGEQEEFMSI